MPNPTSALDDSTTNATLKPNDSILRKLGIVGWEQAEPAILAALISSDPMLLIGRHGTAKSLLLERLAEALDLSFRHYNASILNFDDLVNGNGKGCTAKIASKDKGRITKDRCPMG